MDNNNITRCPYCGEEIPANLSHCRFCGSSLNPTDNTTTPPPYQGQNPFNPQNRPNNSDGNYQTGQNRYRQRPNNGQQGGYGYQRPGGSYNQQGWQQQTGNPYQGQQQNQGYYQQPGYRQYDPQQGAGMNFEQFREQAFLSNQLFADCPEGKSRGTTALLALLLGSLGIHYFYLGKTTGGIVFLLVSILSCGFLAWVVAIVALIQSIMLFCMTNVEFRNRYVLNPSSFPF